MRPYLAIIRLNLLGSPNIGVYALTTNSYTIVPVKTSKFKIKRFRECLKGKIIPTTVGGTRLIGVLAAANSNGIVLPNFALDEEIRTMEAVLDVNVVRVRSKVNAFGNLILVNDYGGVVGKNLMREKTAVQKIEDTLGVEIVQGEIAGLPYVGSLAAATNTGVLAHPMLRDGEHKVLEDVLKVHVDFGTVNGGSPFVSSGILVNDYGTIIGNLTTGPEIMAITNLFEG
jgi:translation initiation factor 6